MKKTIVIINGGPGVGKDTFVDFCKEFAKVVNISSVDQIKEIARIYFGWNGEKTEKSRKMLSDLKRVSIEYNDCPCKYMKQESENFLNSDNDIMFLHIREPEEISKMKNLIKCKTLLITNKNVEKIDTNDSDKNVNNYIYDYIIDNSGTFDELKDKAMIFIKAMN